MGAEHNMQLHKVFINCKRTCDSINRKKLYEAMWKQGVPIRLVRFTKIIITNTKSAAKRNGMFSEPFSMGTGLRQGNHISVL